MWEQSTENNNRVGVCQTGVRGSFQTGNGGCTEVPEVGVRPVVRDRESD